MCLDPIIKQFFLFIIFAKFIFYKVVKHEQTEKYDVCVINYNIIPSFMYWITFLYFYENILAGR